MDSCGAALIGLQAARPPPPPRCSAQRHGHTQPGSPPVGCLLPVPGTQILRPRRVDFDPAIILILIIIIIIIIRAKSPSSVPFLYMRVYVCARGETGERNSNDLIIFLSEPAHKRLRCRCEPFEPQH